MNAIIDARRHALHEELSGRVVRLSAGFAGRQYHVDWVMDHWATGFMW